MDCSPKYKNCKKVVVKMLAIMYNEDVITMPFQFDDAGEMVATGFTIHEHQFDNFMKSYTRVMNADLMVRVAYWLLL